MLAPGDALPPGRVWNTAREPVELRSLAEGGVALFLFYLFDWTST